MSNDFIIDWQNKEKPLSGTLFTSVGLVITYTNQDNIDDKVIHGKVYGVLKSYQVEHLQQLVKEAKKNMVSSQDTYIGYLFYDDHVDKITVKPDEIQTLQYELVV